MLTGFSPVLVQLRVRESIQDIVSAAADVLVVSYSSLCSLLLSLVEINHFYRSFVNSRLNSFINTLF